MRAENVVVFPVGPDLSSVLFKGKVARVNEVGRLVIVVTSVRGMCAAAPLLTCRSECKMSRNIILRVRLNLEVRLNRA